MSKGIKSKEVKSAIVIAVERARPNIVIEECRRAEKRDGDGDDVLPIPVRTQMIEFRLSEEDGKV